MVNLAGAHVAPALFSNDGDEQTRIRSHVGATKLAALAVRTRPFLMVDIKPPDACDVRGTFLAREGMPTVTERI